jgi:hypothetical protein
MRRRAIISLVAKTAYWVFHPSYASTAHMLPVTGTQLNAVSIEMAGNRAGDFKAANQAANLTDLLVTQGRGLDQAPEGYT